jgi:serine protease AprX
MALHPRAPHTIRWGIVALAVCVSTGVAISASPAPRSGAERTSNRAGAISAPAVPSGFAGGKWGDATADQTAKDAYGNNAASKDPGSMFVVGKAVGARSAWGRKDDSGSRVTGAGVAVALLDSGVTQVPGLDGPNKVTYGPDLSIEGNGSLADQDTYGHGTFMAGIIAGRGAANPSVDLPSAPAGVQLGVAPDAELLALKLATTDGSTDVSQVIAGLDWVTEHPVLPDGTRVRVINLSYGTESTQNYQVDPLAAAAENAWKHGIVVVTSGGNDGSSATNLTDPAYDPYLLAVGAADSGDRVDGWSHDHATPASFTNAATGRQVDLIAPGTSLVSLRDPGSFIDTNHPEGRVAGDTSGKLFRGSGTSQAAAVVSGAAADLLQAYPALTPDQVKYALVSGAQTIKNGNSADRGARILDLAGALDVASHLLGTDKKAAALQAAATQNFPASTGQGSIDAARGDAVLVDPDGNPITGEVDAQGDPWDPAAWWAASSSLTAWSGGDWMGSTWTGAGWSTDDGGLSGHRWTGHRWTGHRWTGVDWTSTAWTSEAWSGHRWTADRWSGHRWTSTAW